MNVPESKPEGRVLIVDDEKLTRVTLEVQLTDEGFAVHTATNGFEALEQLEAHDIDVVVTDLRMPSMDGLELLQAVRQKWPDTAVVFITAFGTVASAVDAMHGGAADYLTKPLDAEELVIRVRRLIQRRRDVDEIRELRANAARSKAVGDLVYRSTAMAAVVERALSVADADVTVLIEGETGTGKQVFARLIHENSPRSARPFVTVNSSAGGRASLR
jgi:two-component system response regulator HydG